jgi:universal stress protein A
MMKITRILVPYDWSELSKRAFEFAASMARDLDAEMIVLYAVPVAVEAYGPPSENYLNRLRGELCSVKPRDLQTRIQYRVMEGDPIAAIVNVANELKCELIVMGTHGRGGLRRFLMGSVAEKVIRKAPCLVMTLRGDSTLPCSESQLCSVNKGS